MLWENTDFIDGAVRSRVFCQLYQYDNCVSGRKDAVNRRIADRLWQIGPLVPHRHALRNRQRGRAPFKELHHLSRCDIPARDERSVTSIR